MSTCFYQLNYCLICLILTRSQPGQHKFFKKKIKKSLSRYFLYTYLNYECSILFIQYKFKKKNTNKKTNKQHIISYLRCVHLLNTLIYNIYLYFNLNEIMIHLRERSECNSTFNVVTFANKSQEAIHFFLNLIF